VSRKRVSTDGLIADLFGSLSPSGQASSPEASRVSSSVPSPLDASARFTDGHMLEIPLEQIRFGSHQARHEFNEERIGELAESIRVHGVIEPILVMPNEEGLGYVLIAGERRLRAARLAGRAMIPATVREGLDQADVLVLSLVENLQREDLSPTERAEGIVALQKTTGQNLSTVAKRLGYTKARVSQLVGYRRLPERMYEALSKKRITEKQAQAILRVEDIGKPYQQALFRTCVDHDLRDAEAGRLARWMLDNRDGKPAQAVNGFLKTREKAPSRRGKLRKSRLASLTTDLHRIYLQLGDAARQLEHVAGNASGKSGEPVDAKELKVARDALDALRKRLEGMEGSLEALGG